MSGGRCDVIHQLRSLFDQNNGSNWQQAAGDCYGTNSTTPGDPPANLGHTGHEDADYGVLLYAFITPIIFFIGIIGNLISLRIFFSRNLRKLSASVYLVAISISDILVLLTFVMLDWLRKGLPHFPGGHILDLVNYHGACESFLYFSYLFRFVSVWLLVIFTVERYIAACRPLQRRAICTKSFGRKAILVVFIMGCLISLFKPILSGVYHHNGKIVATVPPNASTTPPTKGLCTFHPDYQYVNFVMEVAFGLSITAVPFVIIAFFNMLILLTLLQRDKNIKRWKLNFKDSRIRWEFTVSLLVVSSTFICLNLPYFVVWCHRFLLSTSESTADAFQTLDTRDQHFITRTIFYVNYCINFFLYCLTGTYYRRELWLVCCCGNHSYGYPTRASMVSNCTTTTHLKEVSRV